MKTIQKPDILELTDTEVKILQSASSVISVAELARLTKIPRTSLVYMLSSLTKRGLLKKIKNKKRFFYIKNSIEEIQNLTNKIPQFFDPSLSVFTLPTYKDIRVYKGVDAIMKIQLETMGSVPIHSRIKAMQTNISLTSLFDNTPVDYTIKFNKLISDRKVILDAIIEDGMYDVLKKYWNIDPTEGKRLTPTFGNRTTDYVSLPNGILNFNTELWMYLDVVIIINWSEKIAIYISNSEIRSMLEALFNVCKTLGNRVNHQIEIEKII